MEKLRIKKRHEWYELVGENGCPMFSTDVLNVEEPNSAGRVRVTIEVGIYDKENWGIDEEV